MFRSWLLALVVLCTSGQYLRAADVTLYFHQRQSPPASDGTTVAMWVTVYPAQVDSGRIYDVHWKKPSDTSWLLLASKALSGTSPEWHVQGTGIISYGSFDAGTYQVRVSRRGTTPFDERILLLNVTKSQIIQPTYPAEDLLVEGAAYFNGACPPRDNLTFKLALNAKARTEQAVTLTVDGTTYPVGMLPPSMYGGFVVHNFQASGIPTASGEFSYSWKVGGQIVASGSYGCSDEILNNLISNGATYEQPPGTPDPGTETPPGTTPPPVTPYEPPTNAPPPPTVPPPNPYTPTGPVSTQEEMYAAVRKGVNDAGADTADVGVPERTPESMEEDLLKRGKLDEIQSQLDTIASGLDQAKGVGGAVEDGKSWLQNNLPTHIGTVNSITLGTVEIAGSTKVIEFDFTTFGGPIGVFRTAMLFAMTVCFVVLCIETFRHYL